LYAVFWFGLAVLVNALGRSSAFNATALAALWLVLVVVVPSLVQLLATWLHPAPSRVELVGLAREASYQATAERTRLLASYYEDHPEMLGSAAPNPANFAAIGYVTQEEVNRQIQPVLERFDQRLQAQQRIVSRYRFLSPAILANDALTDLAGTGQARFLDFRLQVERFVESWKQFFVPRILRADTMRPGVTGELPTFRYREEPNPQVWRRVITPLFGLALLAGVVGWFSRRGTRRYRMSAGV
jgi:ABC-2 type transport system permease protein